MGIHRALLNRVDLERVATRPDDDARRQVYTVIQELASNSSSNPKSALGAPEFTASEKERLSLEVLNEVFRLGPLEPLLQDPTISDILVNGANEVYIERGGVLEEFGGIFKDDAHLMRIIEKIVAAVGRRVDESSPMVDARLADGSRINVIIPPLAIDGPHLSIRRFGHVPISEHDLLGSQALTQPMLELLRAAVRARLNIVVSGGTGAGKTTLLNVLSGYISEKERIVTIEDSAELRLKQRHVVRLECRPANAEGKGAIMQRQLVVNSLRMRPNRIIVGEVRSEEALDMLQAMNTGHDGSLTTVHANSPRDAIARLETMVMMGNLNMPEKAIRRQIASAITLVVQVARFNDGSRRLIAHHRDHGYGIRHHQHAGCLLIREAGSLARGPHARNVHRHRYPAAVRGKDKRFRHFAAGGDVRAVGQVPAVGRWPILARDPLKRGVGLSGVGYLFAVRSAARWSLLKGRRAPFIDIFQGFLSLEPLEH